jgi:hemerythrin-like metal-binding protein
MLSGKSKEIIKEVLFRLVEYTKTHFTYEEDLFAKHSYSEKDDHARQHKEFVDKLYEIVEKFKVVKSFVSIEIMEFLKDWLVNHIMGIDKKYSEFLISKGVN